MTSPPISRSVRPTRSEMETALRSTGGNVSGAARLLDIPRYSFYRWAYQYGMHRIMGIVSASPVSLDSIDPIDPIETAEQCVTPSEKTGPTLGNDMEDDVKTPHSIKVRDSQWQWLQHRAVDAKVPISDYIAGLIANAQEAFESGNKRR